MGSVGKLFDFASSLKKLKLNINWANTQFGTKCDFRDRPGITFETVADTMFTKLGTILFHLVFPQNFFETNQFTANSSFQVYKNLRYILYCSPNLTTTIISFYFHADLC